MTERGAPTQSLAGGVDLPGRLQVIDQARSGQ
jgi:hypothetical protein